MFFVLSKTIYFLCMPLTLIVLDFLLAFFIKKPLWKKRLFLTGFLMLLFFSNQFIIDELVRAWEVKPVKIADLHKKYDIAIVLGGFTINQKEPDDRVYTQHNADRALHTLQLYKLGIVKKIMISGGSGQVFGEGPSEAELAKRLFMLSGVPAKDIITEGTSRNTHENALNSSKILNEQYPDEQYLLVTSGYHMRRALGCFEKAGLHPDTYSTDFTNNKRVITPDLLLLPSPEAIVKWHLFVKEIMGTLVYKILGYL